MKQKNQDTPRLLQSIFIISTLVSFVSSLGMSLYYYTLALNGNISQDYASIHLFSLLWAFAPVVIWGIVHATRRDRKLSISSLFQSLLLTFSAMIFVVALGQVSSLFSSLLPSATSPVAGMWWYTLLSIGVPMVIAICGLILVILHLRRQKQW